MNREEIRELAAVYALGGLDGEELARFEALLRAGDAEATAALSDFEGTLAGVAAGLPPAPEGKTYQLWAIVGKSPPVSAGVFTVDAGGTGSLRVPPLTGVGKVDIFAVTLEPAGGLPAPSGKMYLAGKA